MCIQGLPPSNTRSALKGRLLSSFFDYFEINLLELTAFFYFVPRSSTKIPSPPSLFKVLELKTFTICLIKFFGHTVIYKNLIRINFKKARFCSLKRKISKHDSEMNDWFDGNRLSAWLKFIVSS
jgi:hypothetical protein